jgi:hypothetical protein
MLIALLSTSDTDLLQDIDTREHDIADPERDSTAVSRLTGGRCSLGLSMRVVDAVPGYAAVP